MASLELSEIGKSYGAFEVLRDINLTVADGELIVFVGPSGCGKSTLLRMIAGLEPITTGALKIDGQVSNLLSPVERGIAMVFQSYALYPHMNVRKNMSFGLKLAGMKKSEIAERVGSAAEALEIGDYLDRLPKDLSGGQRQRVAIGRSIVREPKLFLFDEPLSNLDAALRVQTRLEVARLHKRLQATMIYVTHDQIEAMTLADRIVVLSAGRIEQVGAPLELYRRPANLFVAGFIGSPKMNVFDVEFTAGPEGLAVSGLEGGLTLPATSGSPGKGTLGVRPEHLNLTDEPNALIRGRLLHEEHMGEYRLLHIQPERGEPVIAKADDDASLPDGTIVNLTFDARSAHAFDAAGNRLATFDPEESNVQ
ncbi:ABC transporter ATP-binding protein [Martelella mediterranea]|uniref:Multiple sugar transport system ATP-binding protein/alpha-glucoside transport system ATP-binding protein n=1 Tax=Martelella mediterranea TaxID=293089 RepID=A0A4R3NH59_9HYPH|nr:sn-glycerol-3-phosphate ABC transporter ATP-binding protein UgpC [Martelella mediterranea]TCT33072.1 multiple sugar transport system ATP-binding protein/alpha-glucoside transport system ATP-binding protein [Martelella mediterranea]